jgi:Domain of unknown function (DUF4062)
VRIFLSAVSREFAECRTAVASDLRAVGAEVAVQEDFQQQGRTLLEKLEGYIASCDWVIAIVGDTYGAEPGPGARLPDRPRRSYTQWEYFFGQGERIEGPRQQPKDMLVYFATPSFRRPSVPMEADDTVALQKHFITDVRGSGKDWSDFSSADELRRRVLRDLAHFGDRKRVSQSVTAHTTRIQNFIDEYVGTATSPIAFGGRQEELKALDDWFQDRRAPSYALLAAEAGRGKSALLVRWSQSILERRLAPVVFVPVSIRFSTALAGITFPALADGLGRIFGERAIAPDLSPEQWRSICLEYMRRPPPDGGQVLVVVDGLDEAADWKAGPDLFPTAPPPGMRVVVSARYMSGDGDERGWLARLGWDTPSRARTIPLPPLSFGGVHDVLAAVSDRLGALATDAEAVGEIFRLSQGDPLLVRLYIDALLPSTKAGAALRSADLPSIQQGLAGYFGRWEADQNRRAESLGRTALDENEEVQTFLNVCAMALGPLSRDDIAEVAGGSLAATSRLSRVVKEVDRFVVGNGQTSGYVFSHPRLAQYFSERMMVRDRQRYQKKFLDYGRRSLEALNAGEISPRDLSSYVLQYYGAHLERAVAPRKEVYALLTTPWLRAWEAREGTYAGFLGDAERAWRTAEPSLAEGAGEDIAALITSALCRSSIVALSANIPPALMVLCVKHDVLTPLQALTIASRAPDPHQRALAVSALARELPRGLMNQALAAALALERNRERAAALIVLTRRLEGPLKVEAAAEAVAAVRGVDDERERARLLISLLPCLPDEALRLTAVEVAREMRKAPRRARALMAVAASLDESIRPGIEREALDLAYGIRSDLSRGKLLIRLLPYLRDNTRDGVVQEILATLQRLPESASGDSPRATVLVRLAPRLPDRFQTDALEAARSITTDEARARALIGLVPYLPDIPRAAAVEDALDAARMAKADGVWLGALADLAPYLPDGSRRMLLAEALRDARAIDDVERRPMTLARLASHLPKELVAEALEAARAEDGWARATILASLAPRLPEEFLDDAAACALSIRDSRNRLHALLALLQHAPQSWRRAASQRALSASSRARKRSLIALLHYLPEELQAEAVSVAQARPRSSVATLIRLATRLPDRLAADATRRALAGARAIQDDLKRVWLLVALAGHVPPTERMSRKIIDAAKSSGEAPERLDALASLAPCVPAGLMDEVLASALAIALDLDAGGFWTSPRAAAMARLAPHLTGSMQMKALDAARGLTESDARALALTALAPHVSEDLAASVRADALAAAQAIENHQRRAFALDRIVPVLPVPERERVISDAIDAARRSGYPVTLFGVIKRLLPYMSTDLLDEVLHTTFGTFDHELLIELLNALPRALPAATLGQAVELAHAIDDRDYRAAALAAVAPHRADDGTMQRALDHVLEIAPGWIRTMALANLAPSLPRALRVRAVREAATAALSAREDQLRNEVWNALEPFLPEWAEAEPEAARTFWRRAVREFSSRPRPAFLPFLQMLLPLVLAVPEATEREVAAAGIFGAVTAVGEWWP